MLKALRMNSVLSRSQMQPIILVLVTTLLLIASDQLRGSLILPNIIQDFVTLAMSIFVEALPFIVLGAFLATIVNNYVPAEKMLAVLPKKGVFRRGMISSLGFFMPVCECGNVPLSRSLVMQGLKPSEAIAFLLAAPVLNPVTIWSTWAAFGFDPAIVYSRVIATVLIAWTISYVISLKKNEQEFLTDSFTKTCAVHRKKKHQVSQLLCP